MVCRIRWTVSPNTLADYDVSAQERAWWAASAMLLALSFTIFGFFEAYNSKTLSNTLIVSLYCFCWAGETWRRKVFLLMRGRSPKYILELIAIIAILHYSNSFLASTRSWFASLETSRYSSVCSNTCCSSAAGAAGCSIRPGREFLAETGSGVLGAASCSCWWRRKYLRRVDIIGPSIQGQFVALLWIKWGMASHNFSSNAIIYIFTLELPETLGILVEFSI